METIGEKIRRLRKSKGISQTSIAEICNIKQSSYANIESGKTQNITIEIGKGISKALEIDFRELFDLEDSDTLFQKQRIELEKYDEIINEKNLQIKDKELIIKSLQNEKILFSSYLANELVSSFNLIIRLNIEISKLSPKEKNKYLQYAKNQFNLFWQLVENYKELGFLTDKNVEKAIETNSKMGLNEDYLSKDLEKPFS